MLAAQPCPTLCDPMDCSPPGSSVHEISQARILEWVVVSFSGDLPDPGIKSRSTALQADSLPTELQGKPMGKGALIRESQRPAWLVQAGSASVSKPVLSAVQGLPHSSPARRGHGTCQPWPLGTSAFPTG